MARYDCRTALGFLLFCVQFHEICACFFFFFSFNLISDSVFECLYIRFDCLDRSVYVEIRLFSLFWKLDFTWLGGDLVRECWYGLKFCFVLLAEIVKDKNSASGCLAYPLYVLWELGLRDGICQWGKNLGKDESCWRIVVWKWGISSYWVGNLWLRCFAISQSS